MTFASLGGMLLLVTAIVVAAVAQTEFWFSALRFVFVLYLAISLARSIVGQVNSRKRRQTANSSKKSAATGQAE